MMKIRHLTLQSITNVQTASTLYGPHTLSAYIQKFNKLAYAMAKGEKINKSDISPPDLSSKQLSFLLPPFENRPSQGVNFGDTKNDVIQPMNGLFKKGDRINTTFWSANPRYDLLTEGTFAVVEMLQGETWIPVYDDDDFCLYYKWTFNNVTSSSLATIEWDVPEDARAGVYRLRHFGSYQGILSAKEYFTGASSAFQYHKKKSTCLPQNNTKLLSTKTFGFILA